MNSTPKVHLALFTANLIFAINYVLAKMVMPMYFQPFAIILMRVWGAAFLFWAFHALWVREKIRDRRDFLPLLYCSLSGVAANQLMFFKGLSLSSPIKTAIIMTTSPIMILGISVFILKERVALRRWLGMFMGAVGAISLILSTNVMRQGGELIGDVLLLGNAFAYSIYLVIARPLMQKYHTFTVTKWAFLMGSIWVFPFGIAEFNAIQWLIIPYWALGILAFIVVGSTFLAYLLNTWGLGKVHPSVVGFYIYLQPVLTSLIAIALRQDELNWQKIIFCLLIFCGIYLVNHPNKKL
jgi:drug/metabolite transporter (DMT)-like permease